MDREQVAQAARAVRIGDLLALRTAQGHEINIVISINPSKIGYNFPGELLT